MNPESWFGTPGVCGSCLAWRPGEPGPDDEVAVGKCMLRPELRRVPATLGKCAKYQRRGGFSYRERRGAAPAEPGRRRKAATPAVVKVRNDAGELVDVTPSPKARAVRSERPQRRVAEARSSGDGPPPPYVRPPDPVYRPFPPPAEPPPREVDLDGMTAPLVEGALVELLRSDPPGRARDLNAKYRHGGKVVAEDRAGERRALAAPAFFARVERLAKALDALEEAVETHDKLDDTDDLVGQIRRMRGSFTTFNLLFADRADYFSGKG